MKKGNQIIVNGQISINRPQGHVDPHISITVVDTDAGLEFLQITMPLASFAEAVTGMGNVDCNLVVRAPQDIGKVAQHKEEVVIIKKNQTAVAALKPFEVDGWRARPGDLGNMHRLMGFHKNDGRSYKVVFFRRVAKAPRNPGAPRAATTS